MSDKRTRGLRPLAGRLPKLTAPAFAKRGLVEAGVITDWPHIVGKELARTTAPVRLAYQRGERSDGVLHVQVAGGAALEIQHRAPQIVARINSYFGYRAVGRIAIAAGDLPPPPEPKPVPAPPAPEDEAAVRRSVADITDEDTRESLLRLGRSVAAQAANRPNPPNSATNASDPSGRSNDDEDA